MFLEVGAVGASDLGEKWERMGFKAAMEVDAEFVLNEEGAEAGAVEVFA